MSAVSVLKCLRHLEVRQHQSIAFGSKFEKQPQVLLSNKVEMQDVGWELYTPISSTDLNMRSLIRYAFMKHTVSV